MATPHALVRRAVGCAVFLFAGIPSFASTQAATFGPQASGERVIFAFTSTTDSASGPRQVNGTLTLLRATKTILHVDVAADDGSSAAFDAYYERDRTIAPMPSDSGISIDAGPIAGRPSVPFALQRFNEVVEFAVGMPAAVRAGDSWKATVSVPLPGGDFASVPVTVRAAAAGDAAIDLDADGQTRQLFTPAPDEDGNPGEPQEVLLTVHASAHFADHRLSSAKGSLQAEFDSDRPVTVTSAWTLAVAPASSN